MPILAPAAEAAPSVRTDIASELAHLQGVWTSATGPCEARFLIAGNRFAFEFVGGDLYMGTFDLAAGRMDMHIDEGPPQHAGCSSRCIYSLESGVLRRCPGRPGSDRRPESFPDVDDPRHLSFIFRRARARSR